MALAQENRWEARPRLAAALKLVIYLGPIVAGAVAALFASRGIQTRNPDLSWPLVSLLTLPISLAVVFVGERLSRRLLPLALLLKLSLLFPDQVPNRLGTAMRATSAKRLVARLEADDPADMCAAERIISLVAALNAHDRRTRGHSERVRALTMLVADELEIVGEERDKLEWAALLHDLGKLEVPPDILNKRGRPSDEEWAVLRGHPAAGPAHAGELAVWLGDWIHAMDQHHERFDGTGYPLGLEAAEIALSGRIVAVADAFEVMTATRSYKVPMTTQAARDELVKCSGSHFDPTVVRSFMAVSIGEIHGALGPTSWIASLPFSGVAAPIAAVGSSIVGGSVTPALAAAAALTLLSGASAGQFQPEAERVAVDSTAMQVVLALENQDDGAVAASTSEIDDDYFSVFGSSTDLNVSRDNPAGEQDGLETGSVRDPVGDSDLPSITVPPTTIPPTTVPPSTLPPIPPSTSLPPIVGDVVDDVVDPIVGQVVGQVGGVVGEIVDPIVGPVVGPVGGVVGEVVDPTAVAVVEVPAAPELGDTIDDLLGGTP